MNITRLNFRETLPLVRSAIDQAHFLSLDLEMSGIQTEELTSPSLLDSRYEKQRQSIDKFIPLQLGLSAFHVVPQERKIVACPFNFYLFPLTYPNETMRFSFHAGTMNFLANNHFDFNRLFYEGIPYTSRESMRLMEQQQGLNSLKDELKRMKRLQSPEVRAFLKMRQPIVEEWMASPSQSIDVDISFMKVQSYMQLKTHLEEKYPNTPLVFQFDTPEFFRRTRMTIRKCPPQEKQGDSQAPQAQIDSSGALFNQVFDSIVQSKRPMILHNGFLDMMHIHHRFVGELPATWTNYQQNIHQAFPYLYDNKYLFANSPTLNHQTESKMTGLSQCFTAMRELAKREERENKPTLQIEIAQGMKEYNLDSLECHQAGFDSLMTGYSFLKGISHLNPNLNLLTDMQAFHSQQELIRNRIPLGSIKVPFNFQATPEDIYTKDGNSPIHFQSVLNQRVDEQRVCEFFSKKYGPVHFYWTTRNMTQFCINFINKQARDKFLSEISPNDTSLPFSAYKLDSIDFIVLTEEQHQRKMANLITAERSTASKAAE